MKILFTLFFSLMTSVCLAQDISLLQKYADKGDEEAQYQLAECYLNAVNVEQNYELAVKWLTKSSKKNYAPALYLLSICYEKGIGVLVDEKQAYSLCEKACKKEYWPAYFLLGEYYRNGIHVEANLDQTLFFYLKSANNGYAHAQSVLGYLYYWGDPIIGKTKDYNSALKWFLMSAEQNDISALYYLGEMYNDGTGVSRDLNKSLEYHYMAISFLNQL